MTRCTRAAYEDRNKASDARRRLLRQFRTSTQKAPNLSVDYCERCDRYHIIASSAKASTFRPQTMQVLQYVSQGYRDREISDILSLPQETVRFYMREMMQRFNALSRAHLVAISIALGLINPNDFVPEQDERLHA